jgi:hypothetical protein
MTTPYLAAAVTVLPVYVMDETEAPVAPAIVLEEEQVRFSRMPPVEVALARSLDSETVVTFDDGVSADRDS